LLQQGLALAANPLQAAPLLYVRQWLPRLFAVALEQGIEVETVRHLIRKWSIAPENPTDMRWPWAVKICTLGRFEILLNDAPPEFARKPPARLLALLKAIVAFGGTDVPEQRLIDAIWPEDEGDAGAHALNVAITRLRKLLDCPDAIQVSDGRVSLDRKRSWVDAFVFEQAAERLPRGEDFALQPQNFATATNLIDLYRGSFLTADTEVSWTIQMRERLRSKLVDVVESLAQHFESKQNWERAAQYYQRGIEADVLFERFHTGLMRSYVGAGRRAEALSAYRRLRETLSVVLGIPPSSETQALYRTLC